MCIGNVFTFYMHLNILRDLGAPKQQKAHVLQITPCSFQVWKPPQGFSHSPAASGQLIFWPRFHGNENWMGEKRGEKRVLVMGGTSELGKWDFPRLGCFSRIFFPGQQGVGCAALWRWMGGSGWPLLPAAFRAAEQVLKF